MRSSLVVTGPAGLVLWALVCAGCTAGRPFVLVDDGQAAATIVIGAEAGGHLTRAAEALQEYVERMSGATLPIATDADVVEGARILIGASGATEGLGQDLSEDRLGFDGCVATSLGDDLVFLGPNGQGAANGVYWFLNWKLGVQRFGLRDDALMVPARRTVAVGPFSYAHKPSFAWRSSWISSIKRSFSEEERANHRTATDLNRRGGVDLSGAHSLLYLVPPGELFDKHPEYFSLIGGERRKEHSQPCLSNPDVLRRVVNELKKRDPNRRSYVAVSPNDWAGWCECAPCRELSADPAARMLRFCNRVIEAVEPTHPRLGVCFLAYDVSLTMEPPVGLKAHRRVVPLVAPLGLVPVHPLDSPDCPNAANLRRIYEGWSEVCKGGVTTYPYMFGGPFPGALPLPVPAIVARDTRYYHETGLIGVQREHVGHYYARGFGWELSFWLEWQLFWDVDQDVEQLRKVFYEGYYGAAAEPMARIYDRVESAVLSSPVSEQTSERRGWDVALCTEELTASLLPTLAANRHDLKEALDRADTPAGRSHVKADGISLFALDEAVLTYTAFARWKASGSDEDRQSALARCSSAVARMEKIIEQAPFMERLRDRLRDVLAKLEKGVKQ